MCEDEDDCGIDLDSDDEDDDAYDVNNEDQEQSTLYLCPLDSVDEILHLGTWLQGLQAQNSEFYAYLMQCIADEIVGFNSSMQYAALEQQQQQQV